MEKHVDNDAVHVLKRQAGGIVLGLIDVISLAVHVGVAHVLESTIFSWKYAGGVLYEFSGGQEYVVR